MDKGNITRLFRKMARPRIPYNTDWTVYAEDYQVISDCNSITFINQGQSPVLIKGALLLQTGQSFSIDGNEHEFDTTIYEIIFRPNNPTDSLSLVVVRKTYTSNPADAWVYPGMALEK